MKSKMQHIKIKSEKHLIDQLIATLKCISGASKQVEVLGVTFVLPQSKTNVK
jgi:hypothetical protein